MRFKKIIALSLLVTAVSTSISVNTVNASSNNQELKQEETYLKEEKYKGIDSNQARRLEERSKEQREADIKEAEEIKIKGDEIIETKIANDVETIKSLAIILDDDELADKAGPVTEIPVEDIRYIMDVIIDVLGNNNIELEEYMKYKLNNYILSHGPYIGTDKVKEYIESYTQDHEVSVRASYDRAAAVDYLYKWVHSYNTTYYPNLTGIGGDCTNYVSQAVNAGRPQTAGSTGTWWINKINNLYLAPTTTAQYRTSWSSSWPSESAWIFAPAFATHWQSRVLTGEYNASFVADSPHVPYAAPYYTGDVVQVMRSLYNGGTLVGYEPIHSMMISKYSPDHQDYRVNYHTPNTSDNLLSVVANSYRGYRIRFYRMADPR